MRSHSLSIAAAVACLMAACAPLPSVQASALIQGPSMLAAGERVRLELVARLDRAAAQETADGLPGDIVVQHGVRLYRMTYRSQINGRAIDASAVVAVPDGPERVRGLVIYLRGSEFSRSASPTNPSAFRTTEAAVFGGNGFAVVVPDYIGLGASPSPQAFLLTEENVADFRAALAAAHTSLDLERRTPLFITGFSQGGQLSAALHRDVEERPLRGFDLKGTVSVAGPHELIQTFARRLDGPLARNPMAIGYVTWSAYTFAWREGRPLDEIFTPAYVARVANWFGGDMEMMEIAPEFPSHIEQILQPAFLQSLRSGEDFWFSRGLKANETYDWAPRAPLRVVLGGADEQVDPQSTRILFETARARGGNVSIIETPGFSHMQAGDAAYASSLDWFESLAAE